MYQHIKKTKLDSANKTIGIGNNKTKYRETFFEESCGYAKRKNFQIENQKPKKYSSV